MSGWMKGGAIALLLLSGVAVWGAVAKRSEDAAATAAGKDAEVAAVAPAPPPAAEASMPADPTPPPAPTPAVEPPPPAPLPRTPPRLPRTGTADAASAKLTKCQQEAALLFEAVQRERISDPRATLRLVDAAIQQPCLISKRSVLYRIGIYAACSENLPDRVRDYYDMANSDPSLIAVCPDVLSDASAAQRSYRQPS